MSCVPALLVVGSRNPCGQDRRRCWGGRCAASVRTIGQAAEVAQPGDRDYRSRRNVSRMGQAGPRRHRTKTHRITYRAAEARRSSSRVPSGSLLDATKGGVWKVGSAQLLLRRLQPLRPAGLRRLAQLRPVASSRRRLSQRRGILREADSGRSRASSERAGTAEVDDATTTIWANFGAADPNTEIDRDQRSRMPLHAGRSPG